MAHHCKAMAHMCHSDRPHPSHTHPSARIMHTQHKQACGPPLHAQAAQPPMSERLLLTHLAQHVGMQLLLNTHSELERETQLIVEQARWGNRGTCWGDRGTC